MFSHGRIKNWNNVVFVKIIISLDAFFMLQAKLYYQNLFSFKIINKTHKTQTYKQYNPCIAFCHSFHTVAQFLIHWSIIQRRQVYTHFPPKLPTITTLTNVSKKNPSYYALDV